MSFPKGSEALKLAPKPEMGPPFNYDNLYRLLDLIMPPTNRPILHALELITICAQARPADEESKP